MRKFNLGVLLLLSCGHMVVDTFQGALPAILPFVRDNLGLSYTMAGTILIMSNLASSVIQPVFGFLSDKKEKPILLPLGVIFAGIGFSLIPLSPSYALILGLVTISGLGVAAYHPEGFKTARFFTGEKMVTGMSIFSVGGNVGMALGPILALTLVNYLGFGSISSMFLMSLVFAVVIVASRKTIALPERTGAAAGKAVPPLPKGAAKAFGIIVGAIVMRTWTHAGLMTYIPFYFIDHLKTDPVTAGKVVSLFLLGGAFGTLAGAPVADRFGHRFWLRISLITSGCIFPLIFYTEGLALMGVAALLGMVLISSFSLTVVMGQNLMPGRFGMASGLTVGFAIGVGGIGVTLLGLVADHYGVPAALKCIGVLPLLGFLITLFLKYPLAKESESEAEARVAPGGAVPQVEAKS